jgi:hypothetical protein
MPHMMKKVLNARLGRHGVPHQVPRVKGEEAKNDMVNSRLKDSYAMASNLQKLFAQMLWSNQNYVDPSDVLNSVVDDMGVKLPVGEEQDVTEYLLNFMERLEEGLSE